MNYKTQLIDYVIEHEAGDFFRWIDLDADMLEPEERVLIMTQADSSKELDTKIMKKLAKHHIFAAAYLAEREK